MKQYRVAVRERVTVTQSGQPVQVYRWKILECEYQSESSAHQGAEINVKERDGCDFAAVLELSLVPRVACRILVGSGVVSGVMDLPGGYDACKALERDAMEVAANEVEAAEMPGGA